MENKYLQLILCTTLLLLKGSSESLGQIVIPNSKLYFPESQFYNATIWLQNTSIMANGLDGLKFDTYEVTTKDSKTGEVIDPKFPSLRSPLYYEEGTESVTNMEFSPDGKYVLVVGRVVYNVPNEDKYFKKMQMKIWELR